MEQEKFAKVLWGVLIAPNLSNKLNRKENFGGTSPFVCGKMTVGIGKGQSDGKGDLRHNGENSKYKP